MKGNYPGMRNTRQSVPIIIARIHLQSKFPFDGDY